MGALKCLRKEASLDLHQRMGRVLQGGIGAQTAPRTFALSATYLSMMSCIVVLDVASNTS